MNYFAHGRPFLDSPYFLAGTALPDWLNVVDRRVRVRSRQAELFRDDPDPQVAALAGGITQHHRDDAWFHETRAFAELSWQLTVAARDALSVDDGFRPSFLGHILVEILLDAVLIAREPEELEVYYRALEAIDPAIVHAAVARIGGREAQRLDQLIPRFCRERFLCDYADDARLVYRLNQVMRRVKLPPLPDEFARLLPQARRDVEARAEELLAERATPSPSGTGSLKCAD